MKASWLFPCALAGGVGAALRSLVVYQLCERRAVAMWQALLLINVIGCTAAGVCLATLHRVDDTGLLTALAIAGLLGGFTTFSSYAVECVELWHRGARRLSAAYAVGTIAACGGCASAGFVLAAGGMS